MNLSNRGRSQRLDVKIIKPGLNREIAHRLFDLLFRQLAFERGDFILQQRQLIGNHWREQVTAGGEHLAELDPDRSQLLKSQPQSFTKQFVLMAIRHPE